VEQTVSGPDAGKGPDIPAPVAAAVDGVAVRVAPGPAAAMTEAGDGWLGRERAVQAARLVVAAWTVAVDGDESALTAISDDDAARYLIHPVRQNWVIAPGPRVTDIDLWQLDRDGDERKLGVRWRFTADQRYAGPAIPPGWLPPGDREYVGSAHLTLDESRPWPWRLTHGSVRTIDAYYGYAYATRDESAEEYNADGNRARIGEAAGGPVPRGRGALVLSGTYRLVAGYAEHDEKFAGTATADVDSDGPLSRDDAQRLAESAIDADARQRMAALYPQREIGEDDVRPSLSSLEVIRLLCPAPAVEPAAGDTEAAVAGFAQRYAGSRGLIYQAAVSRKGDPAEHHRYPLAAGSMGPTWQAPGPWFLSSVDARRSFGRVWGSLGGGPAGELWFTEGQPRRLGRSRRRWTVARYEILQARRAGGIACMARQWPSRRDRALPRGLTPVPTGDARFDELYTVAVAGGEMLRPADGGLTWAERLFRGSFTAWMAAQPYGEHGADAVSFQAQDGLVGVFTPAWRATPETLDDFVTRASGIAAAIEHATRFIIQ
jgi:hypothetical protein